MKEHFDDIIRKKLTEVDIEPKGLSWDAFKEQYVPNSKHVNELNQGFDDHIKATLAQYRSSYKASHWRRLRSQLRRQARNLENLYVSKAFEFITIILLLLIFSQNDFYIKTKVLPSAHSVASVDLTDKENHTDPSKTIDNQSLTKDILLSKNEINSAQTDATISSDVSTASASNATDLHVVLNSNSVIEHAVTFNEIPLDLPENITSHVLHIPKSYHSLSTMKMGDLDHLASIDPQNMVHETNFVVNPNFSEVVSHVGTGGAKKLSVYYSADNYIINTPPDQVYKNIGEVLFNSVGFSGGASFDSQIGKRIEIGAGLEFAEISYSPQQINEVFLDHETGGVYNIFLDEIKFKMISLPLNMKLKLAGNENWSLYTQMGISPHVVAISDFATEVTTRVLPSHGPPQTFDVQEGSNNQRPGPSPRLFDKTFVEGFAEGGNLVDNLYFTANLGIGFGKKATERIGLFSLLNYKSNVFDFGVGPNDDKLATLSFTAGVQYTLN